MQTDENLASSRNNGNAMLPAVFCRLVIQPVTLRSANTFVLKYHRHHKPVVGAKFSIGLFCEDELVGVAICGRPVGRFLDDGLTVEVNRLCLKDNIENGCSKLYSVCARIAKEMGYKKIITYILMSETGISLKASGWILDADNVGGVWNSSGNRTRTNETTDLFGTSKKYPAELKQRWLKVLSNGR